MDKLDSNEALRAWAIEQIIKHHNGMTPIERVIGEANQLIAYVRGQKPDDK